MRIDRLLTRVSGGLNDRIATVMFIESSVDISDLDIAKGPCASSDHNPKPPVSPLSQDLGETFEHTSWLLNVLTGDSPASALDVLARTNRSTLSRCSEAFVHAMSAASSELLLLASVENDETAYEDKIEMWARRWEQLSRWPPRARSLRHNLSRMGWGRVAEESGEALFVWHGPSVPMAAVSRSS